MDADNTDCFEPRSYRENTNLFCFFIFIYENLRNLRPYLLLELKRVSPIMYHLPTLPTAICMSVLSIR